MPIRNKIFYREYCSNCDDFEIFERTNNKDKTCNVCGTQHNPNIDYSSVDRNKIQEQRLRYAKYRTENFKRFYGNFNFINRGSLHKSLHEILKPQEYQEIIESDAGLEEEIRIEAEIQSNIRKERILELQKFSNTKRNDKCLCGSNLKYKKCCQDKHSGWKL